MNFIRLFYYKNININTFRLIKKNIDINYMYYHFVSYNKERRQGKKAYLVYFLLEDDTIMILYQIHLIYIYLLPRNFCQMV